MAGTDTTTRFPFRRYGRTGPSGSTARAWTLLLGLLACAVGCGSGSLTGNNEMGGGGGGGGTTPGTTGDWDIRVVDANGVAGTLPSLAILPRGTPAVSYFASAEESHWVRYAAFDGWTWEIETIHETDTPAGCPLAVDPAGNPVITFVGGEPQDLYYWPFQSDLLLARGAGAGWERETVVEEDVVGLWSSVAYDGFGLPGVSYQDLGTGIDYRDFHLRDVRYARFDGHAWEIETVEEEGGGYYTQLLFDAEDRPAVAYCGNLDEDTQPVKLAHRGDAGWQVDVVDLVGECAEGSLSARTRPLGGYGIVYYDDAGHDLRYAAYFGGFWHVETVESHNKVGKYCSLAYGPDGHPVISYYYCGRSTDSDCQGGGDLRVARRTQTGWQIETVDSTGNTGLFTDLEITGSGETFLAYHDATLGALKLAVQR